MIWFLLACTEPVVVELTVVDVVDGQGLPDVEVRFVAEPPRCLRSTTTDGLGRARAALCPEVDYTVELPGRLQPMAALQGLPEALPDRVEVVDRAEGLALVGGGAEPLNHAVVDVRRVRPKGHDGTLPLPAILPVALPTWTATRALFVPEGTDVQAVPVLPTDTLELQTGGPLQPWYALGVQVTEAGPTQVPPAAPASVREVPGGALWMGLPQGTYALWDGEAARVPLVRVE